MPQFTDEESKDFMEWVLHEINNLHDNDVDPGTLAKYVKTLVQRDLSKDLIMSSLGDFISEDDARVFAEKLHDHVARRDFKFEKPNLSQAPPPIVKLDIPRTAKPEEKPIEKKKQENYKRDAKKEEIRTRFDHNDRRDSKDSKKDFRESRDMKRDFRDSKDNKRDYRDSRVTRDFKQRDVYQKRRGDDSDSRDFVKKPKYEKKPRYSSDSESESESDSRDEDTQAHSLEKVNEEPEFKPKVAKERFIIFVAGLQEEFNTIGRICKAFQKFGRVAGIEEDKENGVCFIEYTKLSSAYRAICKGQKVLQNKSLRVEFANEPDEDALNAIKNQIEERKKNWEESHKSENQDEESQKSETQEEESQDPLVLLKKSIEDKKIELSKLSEDQVKEREKLLKSITGLEALLRENTQN